MAINLNEYFGGGVPNVSGSGGGAETLNELLDVTLLAPVTGEALKYNGSVWTNDSISWLELTDTPVVPVNLDDLADVNTTGVTDGQALTWNQTAGEWEASSGAGASSLDELSDVSVIATTDGFVLRANGTSWVSAQLDYADLANAPTVPVNGDFSFVGLSDTNPVVLADGFLHWDGTGSNVTYKILEGSDISDLAPVATAGTLGSLDDVDITGLADGNVITYSSGSSTWVVAPFASNRIQDDDNDTYIDVSETDDTVTVQAGPDSGDILLKPNTTTNAGAAVIIGDPGAGTLSSETLLVESTAGDITFSASTETIIVTGTGNSIISADVGLDLIAASVITLQGLTYPNADGTTGQVIATNGTGILSFVDPGLSDAPAGSVQYTRYNNTWDALGTRDINLATGAGINDDSGNNLLDWTLTSGSDPLFPNVPFVHIGDTGMAIDINAVLFQPLQMKNDTAIQAYLNDYSQVLNVASMSADDFITIGDGGGVNGVPVAIRAEDLARTPVVRMGAFGSTTDYEIFHEGNPLTLDDLGDVTITTPAFQHVLQYSAGGQFENVILDYTTIANTPVAGVDFAAVVHGHAISDVTGLQVALDGKVNVIGSVNQLGDVNTTNIAEAEGQILAWNDTLNEWQRAAAATGGFSTRIEDANSDTFVDTELSTDTVNIEAAIGGGGIVLNPNDSTVQVTGTGASEITSTTALTISTDAGDITLAPTSGIINIPGSLIATSGISITTGGALTLDGQIFPSAVGSLGQVLTVTNAGTGQLGWATSPAGVTTFVGLSDTPADYTGANSLLVSVNAGGTALEFIPVPASDVTSVFGRSGDVASAVGDYTSSQVNNASAVAGASVTDALNALDTASTGEAPTDSTQYTRYNSTWDALGTRDIALSTGIGIDDNAGNNLLDWTLTSGADPLFPNVTFVHVGETGMAIDINAVLFQPLKMKNDTALQAYDSTYTNILNIASMSADNFITIGDGGGVNGVPVAIRAEDAARRPVLRQGAFGSTTDFNIAHAGDSIDLFADVDTTTAAPTLGQVLEWDNTNWVPGDKTTAAVDSVFGRTGVVVAVASDYDASQVDNDSGVTGAFVSDALDTLDTDKIGDAPADSVQYTRYNNTWDAIGTRTILMNNDTAIASRNLADDTNIGLIRLNTSDQIELGDTNTTLIRFTTTAVRGFTLENDDGIKGFYSGNVDAYNLISTSTDDYIIVGDGGTATPPITAIRADSATQDPVVRQGTFGSTTDYPILHEGNKDLINLGDLGDVDTTGVVDGQIIEWDNTGSEWVVGDKAATGATVFTGLTDTPANYTGSENKIVKVNGTPDALEFGADLADMEDVSTTAATDGQVLAWNNTGGEWEPTTVTSGTRTEYFRVDYNLDGTVTDVATNVSEQTSNINVITFASTASNNIVADVTFNNYTTPPTGIFFYGYAYDAITYNIKTPTDTSNGNKVVATGTPGSPGAIFGSFDTTGTVSSRCDRTPTGASNGVSGGLFATHCYVVYKF